MPERIRNGKSASLLKPLQAGQFDASRPKPLTCVGPNRDQPWGYRYYEITLSCPARVRAQLAFRVGDDLGVGRPSIYTTESLAIYSVNRSSPICRQHAFTCKARAVRPCAYKAAAR